jgi:hypothetical protein
LALQAKQDLDLAHHLAAGGITLEDLPQPAPEDPTQRINALPAVVLGEVVLQARGGQEARQPLLDLAEGGLPECLEGWAGGANSQGSEAFAELRKIRRHRAVFIPLY